MASELPRPLHRLTTLRDDPAEVWLSPAQRLRVRMLAWRWWALYGFALWLLRMVLLFVVIDLVYYAGYLPTVLTAMIGAAVFNPMRRMILRKQTERRRRLLLAPPRDALQVDDWAALEAEPDGRVVSVVGWARARLQLSVAGEQCLGLALPCQQKFPGLLETLHDFDLVDEQERPLSIKVTDARLFGTPNLALNDGHQRRTLVASLNLPVGAVLAGWETYVLRDGDPVMVLGVKQTLADPAQHGSRQVPLRAVLGSAPNQPMLIFALNAERRPAPEPPAAPVSFSWG